MRNFAEVYAELMPRDSFIHLHLHTEYSLLDGANRILSGGQSIQEVLERAASKAARLVREQRTLFVVSLETYGVNDRVRLTLKPAALTAPREENSQKSARLSTCLIGEGEFRSLSCPAWSGANSVMGTTALRESQAGAINTPAILTKREAADYLKVSPRYLEQMVRGGRLRAFKPTTKLWRVRLSDLNAFLESGASITASLPKGGQQ